MNRKSKEDILQANLERVRKENPSYADNIVDHIDEAPVEKEISFLAMQEYADREMAAFNGWVERSPFIRVDDSFTHVDNIDEDGKLKDKTLLITTQQLIQKYKDENRTNIWLWQNTIFATYVYSSKRVARG